MKTLTEKRRSGWFAAILIMLLPIGGHAFDSGSTGADGAFNPVVNTQVQLPPDGIFNFTTVNIPSGVTVTFAKNDTNTPVTILASGNVTINGTLSLNGGGSTHVGAAGDGNLGDDGIPGRGGPGGFDGGIGGQPGSSNAGGEGLGPGGGRYGRVGESNAGCGGGGGGFAGAGETRNVWVPCRYTLNLHPVGGSGYGVATLLPLIGGSGGGGGSAGPSFAGSGGGGGGGAILIASSGTVSVNGVVRANGGTSGSASGTNVGGTGGGGAGGAIRIVATTIQGNGTIEAVRGSYGTHPAGDQRGSWGAFGRIRLEAENFLRTTSTNPVYSFGNPGDVFVAGMPSISITSVAGVVAPVSPTGDADIILPETTPNPVVVEFASSNVPVGNTIALKVIPANAAPINTLSDALSGTDAFATASATVNLPSGPSVLQASVSFTVVAALGDFFSNFAMGERVERIEVNAIAGRGSQTTFITVSGKEYTWPSNAVAFN